MIPHHTTVYPNRRTARLTWSNQVVTWCATRSKPQTFGTAQEQKKTKTAYNQPKRPPIGTSHRQAPGNIERAAQESSHTTPTSTETLHATNTATSSHHHTDLAGSLPKSYQPTQPSAYRRRAEPHHNTDTAHTSGDSRHPLPGGACHQEELLDSHGRSAGLRGGGISRVQERFRGSGGGKGQSGWPANDGDQVISQQRQSRDHRISVQAGTQ